jgi:hypothetical protein
MGGGGASPPFYSAGLSPCARRSIAGDFSHRGATMPLTRVSLLKGKPPEYSKAILDGLYQAMRESFGVPEDDRFMLIEEYDKSNFNYG